MSKNVLDHMLHAHNWRLNTFNKGFFIPGVKEKTLEELEHDITSIYKMHRNYK